MVKRLIIVLSLTLTSCDPGGSSSSGGGSSSSSYTGKYIYVASGTTFAGTGVTMSTPVNVVARFKEDGTFDRIVRDYTANASDSPVAMVDYDETHLLVAVENTSSRRVEVVAKDGSTYTTWVTNAALTQPLTVMENTPDGGFLLAKGTASPNGAIEKFSSAGGRVGAPFITAPAGSCATSTTRFSGLAIGPSNNIFAAHAAASTNNKIIIISATGYSGAGDCLGATTGATANHIPTAIHYTASGVMLVGYGNNTGNIHQVYSYTASATALSGATVAFNNTSVLQGISVIAEDADGAIYIASASSGSNTIEKFTLSGGALTRVGTLPLIGPNVYTRSVSGIVVD